jgi:uncharacterized protein (TIGR03000 family)
MVSFQRNAERLNKGGTEMFRKAHTLGAILVLAAAVVLVTPRFGQAQHGGGGGHGGGGAHFSGGGGAHFSGGGGARVGGYSGGIYHSGISNYGGYRPGNSYGRSGYGYRPSRGYYGGYYPYYGLYGSYPDSGYYGGNYDNPYTELGTTETPSYADVTRYYLGAADPPAAGYQASYPPSAGTAAQLTVNVPADALVWFDGEQMTTTGSVRTYASPPLAEGQYRYEVRARWNENGREVTQTQQVGFTPGAHVEVNFPMPSGTAEKTPAVQKS